MNVKNVRIMTILVILLNAATVSYVLGQRPVYDNIAPYVEPYKMITTHEWARDQALMFLKLAPTGMWTDTDVTPLDTLGTSVHLFESGELSVRVSHCLNPTADYFVDVSYLGQSWSMRVSQMG